MANITTYLENKLLQVATGTPSALTATATYAALFTTTPTVAYADNTNEDGVEVLATTLGTANGYSRKQISWGSPSSGIIKNTATNSLSWTATGQWSSGLSVTTIGIFDSGTIGQGNLLWFGPLSAPVIMNSGDTFTIPADSLTISIS